MRFVPLKLPGVGRSRRRCAALGLSVLLVQTATAAEDWQFVGTDSDDNRYSVQVAGTARDGDLVHTQVRTEYVTPRDHAASSKRIFVVLDTMVVDCANASFAIEYREYVAADGATIPVVATPREKLSFKAAAAGSISEAIVRFVCRSAAQKR